MAETIRLAAAAGAVGGSIEDATGNPARPVYDHGEALERVAAAVEAARALAFPFMLVARAENFLSGRPDLDDTIRRLQAFAQAVADVLFAPGLPDLVSVAAVCRELAPRPLNVLAGRKGGDFAVASLAAAGARRISVGSALTRAALGEFLRGAREMKDHGTFTFADEASTFADLNGFMLEP